MTTIVPCQYTREEMQSVLTEREKDPRRYTQDQVIEKMNKLIDSSNRQDDKNLIKTLQR